jgi:hypothetical protein
MRRFGGGRDGCLDAIPIDARQWVRSHDERHPFRRRV